MKEIKILFYLFTIVAFAACSEDGDSLNLSNNGSGGSTARFTISENHLYIVSRTKLIPYDVSDPWDPQLKDDISIGLDIETVFPYQQYLFIGAETGMHIYDISSPGSPNHVSSYAHVRSCDPVVVQGDYAYVTLRSVSDCGGTTNVLEVIDISNIKNPTLVNSYSMSSPYGLGVDDAKLFVCEGSYGIEEFDATDPVNLSWKGTAAFHSAYDLIMKDDLMIVTGEDGVFQYDYGTPDTLIYLSKIDIVKDEI